ncbi:MAG: cupin domain-containing protein [Actinobacteria bacterium]|nr:MAG: cupin domain-containing protein [Actinomycetota bacterium]
MQTASTPTIHVGAIEVRFLVEAEDCHGAATVFECVVPADARVPAPHSHDAFEETVYGLEGVSSFTVDGDTHDIGPGEAICIRRGQVHHFVNQGRTDAKFLSVATPGIFGPAYFREIRDVLAASAGGPPDVAALVEVMRRHGLTPA